MMELSELTVHPAVALPKDFDGVVFLHVKQHITMEVVRRLRDAFNSTLPNARCIVLDGGVTIASIEPENK